MSWQIWGTGEELSVSVNRGLIRSMEHKSHTPGLRVMGQHQGRSDSEKPSLSVPLIIHEPPAHGHVRDVREAARPDSADSHRPWRAMCGGTPLQGLEPEHYMI